MTMTGEYRHTIDGKGRLFIPSKLREELGDTVYLTKGFDNCVAVYSCENWKEIENRLREWPATKARGLQRSLCSKARPCDIDSQGRIVVPQQLREYANLQNDAVILGVTSRAEIWNAEAWDKIDNEFTSADMEDIMAEMGF